MIKCKSTSFSNLLMKTWLEKKKKKNVFASGMSLMEERNFFFLTFSPLTHAGLKWNVISLFMEIKFCFLLFLLSTHSRVLWIMKKMWQWTRFCLFLFAKMKWVFMMRERDVKWLWFAVMLFPRDEYAELCGCKLILLAIAVRFLVLYG